MRNIIRAFGLLGCVVALSVGCASHSHKSVRTYDYDDSGTSHERSDHGEHPQNELNSEYQMVSPGEMKSPGMPVVEPR